MSRSATVARSRPLPPLPGQSTPTGSPWRGKRLAARVIVIAAILGIIGMWIYAFVFADDRPLAQLDDKAWTERAQEICLQRDVLLDEHAEKVIAVSDGSPQAVGAAVATATVIIEEALDEVLAVQPATAEDRQLVDEWERLYRIYLDDRRDVAERLLAGEDAELNETTLNGSPISATIADFTKPNRMPACAAPPGK